MFAKAAPLARVHIEHPTAGETIALRLSQLTNQRSLVIVCVGTDRSTGDSLGPLVGSKLTELNLPGITVYGTLDRPVHAVNLAEYTAKIHSTHPRSSVIAVDACLGRSESVGFISLKKGPLKPGTGVNKDLPAIGDYHLIGVVNVGGFMEYFVLQNTRLSLVMRMAGVITEAIRLSFQPWELNEFPGSTSPATV